MELAEDFQTALDDAKNLVVKDSQLADLCGISPARLSRLRNGADSPTYPEVKNLRLLLNDLQELQRRANGIPIDWKNIGAVRRLLEALRSERENPPAPLTPAESLLISKFAQAASIDDLAIEVRLSRADLLEMVSGILARATRIAEIAAATK